MSDTFPGAAYLICGDARTGSSLLAATLRATGRAGKPFEYFTRVEIDKPWLRAELGVPEGEAFAGFPAWRDRIVAAGAALGGVFGASVHFWQWPHCVETFRADPATPDLDAMRRFFPRLRLIWLRRDNIVAQAISHHVAISTNLWNSRAAGGSREADRGAAYDFERIDHQVQSALNAQAGWRETLKGAEPITMRLSYEELAADLPGVAARVCEFVGADLGGLAPRAPGLEKQAGAWSGEMERRYREERARRGLGPVGDEGAL